MGNRTISLSKHTRYSHFLRKRRAPIIGNVRTKLREGYGTQSTLSMSFEYFGGDDDPSSSSDESLENFGDSLASRSTKEAENADLLWSRSVVHLDVDCFYCQCEEIDGPPDYRERPIAIGQKHIIVTSNYVARSMGVKKLQSRTAAKEACPNLLIIEGSDLERYRKHSRRIYDTFRRALQSIRNEVCKSSMDTGELDISAKKGGMDEMWGDLTDVVRVLSTNDGAQSLGRGVFIYGDMPASESSITLTEDQSGATSTIGSLVATTEPPRTFSAHTGWRTDLQTHCVSRLRSAGVLAERIRLIIKEKTGFSTTVGVSVSPMLAKLAADLKKPSSTNILYPWRSWTIILSMPLRKVPELGSRTLVALQSALLQHHKHKPQFWTCRHLLQVPSQTILESLNHAKPERDNGALCDLLLKKCRGIDPAEVEDDDGGLNKTVSVENSFRRGTLTTRRALEEAMESLFVRLPRLLDDRMHGSHQPDRAYPTTIRVTTRVVDQNIKKRRPFLTKSKQNGFNGRKLLLSPSISERSALLRKATMPLVEALLFHSPCEMNVTRLNVAVTNFADLQANCSIPRAPQATTSVVDLLRASSSETPQRTGDDVADLSSGRKRKKSASREQGRSPTKLFCKGGSVAKSYSHSFVAGNIDAAVLDELPEEIADEIRRSYGLKKAGGTLKHYFRPKQD